MMLRSSLSRSPGSAIPRLRRAIGLLGMALVVALTLGLGEAQPVQAQQSPVPDDASVERIASDFQFTEGPLWYEGMLIFSDIPANTIYQWTPDGGTSVFLKPSGHSNGLAKDTEGRLLLAQHDGQLGRWTSEGSVTPLAQQYEGKRLNSPNDLTVAEDGSVYFTDPPYGVDEDARELDFAGVYRWTDGTLTLLSKEFSRPNGICLSPDGSTLYVNDTAENAIWAYDVADDGSIMNRRQFAALEGEEAGGTDGMKVDADGNLYTTGPGGIWVYGPDGELLDRISVPVAPTNVAFGGEEGRTLYITARPDVYRISVEVPGAN